LPQGRDDVAHSCAQHVFHHQHFQFRSEGHDIGDEQILAGAAGLGQNPVGLLAIDIAAGEQPEDVVFGVADQQDAPLRA